MIDVGIEWVNDLSTSKGYKLVGDLDFEAVEGSSVCDHVSTWMVGPDDSGDVDGEYR